MTYNFKNYKTLSLTELKSDIDNMESLSENDLNNLYSATQATAKFYFDRIIVDKPPFKVLCEGFNDADIKSQIREAYRFASEYYEIATKQSRAYRLFNRPTLNPIK